MSAKKRRSGPFVLAFGGEEYLLDRVMERGRTWEGRSVTELDGDGLTDVEFVSACEMVPFSGEPLVVVLDNAHKLKVDKALGRFIEGLSKDDESVTVVAIFRSEKLPASWDGATDKGQVYNYPRFKPWQEDKIQARIVEEAKRLNLAFDEGIPGLFVKLLGDNLRRTVNEMNKLVHLVGPGGKITKKEVAAVIAPDVPAEPFEVAEAATSKDVRTALRLVSVLYKTMGDGASVPITASLMKQVEKLLIARQMLDRGDSIEIIATRLEMHKFVLQKSLLPKAQKFTVAELRDQMRRLCRLETQVKGAARSKRTLVELAVLSIAA